MKIVTVIDIKTDVDSNDKRDRAIIRTFSKNIKGKSMCIKELLKFDNDKKLDIKYPITLKDSKGNEVYYEDSDGYWYKREYDSNGNEVYYENSYNDWHKKEYDFNSNEVYHENSDGYWIKKEYDSNSNEVYYEDSDGNWYKREYDSNSNEVYFEDSDGEIRGTSKQTKELTVKEIEKLLGHSVKIIKGR